MPPRSDCSGKNTRTASRPNQETALPELRGLARRLGWSIDDGQLCPPSRLGDQEVLKKVVGAINGA